MAGSAFEQVRRRIDAPVPPSESFARLLLERLEEELAGDVVDIRDEERRRWPAGLSVEELDRQVGAELPLREAMSVIDPSLATPTTGPPLGTLGDEVPRPAGGGQADIDETT
jgi:hypothetical protein